MNGFRILPRLAMTAFLCACLHAQTASTISIQIRDGKSGLPVKASNFLIRADRHDTIHPEWVKIDDDGTVLVTIPAGVKEISVKATYEMGMSTYINCDVVKETDKERDIWYPVSLIVKNGVVAPNECARTEFDAKPGEFIFFVRKRAWRDHPED